MVIKYYKQLVTPAHFQPMVPPCLFGFVVSHHVSQAAHAVHGAGGAGRSPAPKGHPHGGNSGQPLGA